jgi:PTH2 family peptidyl-tRNA hydrolase
MAYEIKQIIVVRHDLHMRAGKIAAQACHASISFITTRLRNNSPLTSEQKAWIDGSFAKVCLRVESEKELMDIKAMADQFQVECHLITDAGKTEFHGVPTRTCLALGPDKAEKIDKITGHLKLL